MKTNKKINKKLNKKTQKQNKKIYQPSKQINKTQNQNNLQSNLNQTQQPTSSQAIFQQPTNEDALENDQQINNKIINKKEFIQKCEVGNGYMFIVNQGECYRVVNRSITTANIAIIDGSIDANGKIYYQLFGIKCDSDLVITICQKQRKYNKNHQKNNHIQKINNKQKVEDNNKKLSITKKIPSNKPNYKNLQIISQNNQQIKYSNKQKEQIINKIKFNQYILQTNNKQQNQINNEEEQINKVYENLSLTISNTVIEFITDYKSSQQALFWTKNKEVDIIKCQQCTKPWDKIPIEKYMEKGGTTLLIGAKNTGKSMFCSYIENQAIIKNTQICIIDLDIGRNRTYPGCISLTYKSQNRNQQNISLWIGEYTPLNNTFLYIKAIRSLYQYYKQKYFTSSLIINTMGYITGLGELMLYEIFHIVKPQNVLFMQNTTTPQHFIITNIQYNLKSGKYTQRLYFKQQEHQTQTSTNIQKYTNYFANQKPAPQRFSSLISKNPPKSIEDLIFLILSKKLKNLTKTFKTYRGGKEGHLFEIDEKSNKDINMRLAILGQIWRDKQILVKGVGFIWNNSIFYDPTILQQQQVSMVLIPDGIDFQRTFYQINQSKLIQMELCFGCHLPFISPIFKGLGNKGMRNNPAKKILNNRV